MKHETGHTYIPLAERCRPEKIDEIIGHDKYFKKNSPLRRQIEADKIPSMILWGPPGVGKTTIAKIIANRSNTRFSTISAVTSGIKDLKEIIKRSELDREQFHTNHILFIDEIHRFNKAQQDGLLHAVEDGTLKLIGATTENPSFEIIPPLLSRCQVLKLEPLSIKNLERIVWQAIQKDETFSKLDIQISGMEQLLHLGSGDARRVLNLLEICLNLVKCEKGKINITGRIVKQAAEQNVLLYDKKGDYHYDNISAFIKSVRGSAPNAAVYYLARMLDAGEDPVFIARRLIILASEDIGNAEPYALSLANAALQAVHAIGMPEARIVLSQVTTYLASCAKSNAAYLAIDKAMKDARDNPTAQVPYHLRNAPTKLMKNLEYGFDYKYPHDHPDHFVQENYLPEELKNKVYYHPTEKTLKERLEKLWKKKK
jgi:putative ATPase